MADHKSMDQDETVNELVRLCDQASLEQAEFAGSVRGFVLNLEQRDGDLILDQNTFSAPVMNALRKSGLLSVSCVPEGRAELERARACFFQTGRHFFSKHNGRVRSSS